MKKIFTLAVILFSVCFNISDAIGQACAGTPATATITTSAIVTPLCGGSTQTINANSNVVSTGNFLQWQQSTTGSAPWTNIGSPVASTPTSSYTTPALYTTTYYRLADSCGNSHLVSYSAAFQVPINSFNITTQPTNASVCAGSNTSFSVTASGTTLAYQWYVNTGSGFTSITNGGVYGGATSATLTITGATAGMNGYLYECAVSDACNPATYTAAVTLSVAAAPTVTTPPADVTACVGSNTSFTIIAAGSNITYQWQLNTGSGYAPISNGGVYSGATTSTLNINGVTNTMSGYTYRCVLTSSPCTGVLSTGATLTVNTLPAVTSQPLNDTVCSGTNAFFATTATGTGVTYQWQVNAGSGFVNATNGALYSGATTGTLNITNATSAMSGYLYQCVVTGACSPAVTTSSALLFVTQSPAITTQPPNDTICAGGNALYSIIATGGGLTYQWQVNSGSGYVNCTTGALYSGVNTNTLTVTGVTAGMNGYLYRCIATSSSCSAVATSNGGSLAVNTLPAITGQPSPTTVCAGANTTLSVAATGTALTYQWQVGGVNVTNGGVYSGATTATLTITGATAGMNGNVYTCIVSGKCSPSVTSNPATLTVTAAPVFTTQPSASSVCAGSNTSFTVAVTPVSGVVFSYQWQVNPGTGFVNATGAPYTNGTTATLNITGATVGMNGYTYRCVVTANTCNPGTNSNAVTLTVNPVLVPSVTIAANPGTTICAGTSVTFTPTLVNGGTLPTYQWKIGAATVGFGTTYTSTTLATGNSITCTITSNAVCASPTSATSNALVMTVNPLPTATATAGGPTTFCTGGSVVLTANAGAGISYQWYNPAPGTPIGGAVSQTYTANATGSYSVKVTNTTTGCNATSTAVPVTVNPLPSNTVNAGGPTTFCNGGSVTLTAAAAGMSYQWKFNTFNVGANAQSYVATVTGTYSVVITNSLTGCSSTSVNIPVTVNPLPSVAPLTLSGPSTFCVGDSLTMTVPSAAGITYQWYSTPAVTIPGATSNSYKTYTSGSFYVKATNSNTGCTATSSTTTVTANPLPVPTISAAGPISFCSGGSVTLNALPTGSGYTYVWRLNGVAITGATASSYSATATGNYTVKVTSGANCSAISNTISVNVNPLPAVPVINAASSTTFCIGNSVYLSTVPVLGNTYQWNASLSPIPGATGVGYLASAAGNYSVATTSDSGCSTSSLVTVVTVNPLPPTPDIFSSATTFCWGNTVQLTQSSIGGVSYQWYDNNNLIIGATSDTYNAPDSGNYTLMITDGNGCSSVSAGIYLTAIILTPAITASGSDLCATGGTFASYQWYLDGSAISGATNSCYTPTQNGTYYVVVSDTTPCTMPSAPYLVSTLGVSNTASVFNNIKIYPNPATSVIHVDAPLAVNVSITSLQGKVVLQTQNVKDIDISQVASGIYMIQVYDKNNNLLGTQKLVKTGW